MNYRLRKFILLLFTLAGKRTSGLKHSKGIASFVISAVVVVVSAIVANIAFGAIMGRG